MRNSMFCFSVYSWHICQCKAILTTKYFSGRTDIFDRMFIIQQIEKLVSQNIFELLVHFFFYACKVIIKKASESSVV